MKTRAQNPLFRQFLRQPRGWVREMGAAVFSVALPSGCRICDQLLTAVSRVPICSECLASFRRIDGSICEVCGTPVADEADDDAAAVRCRVCANGEERVYAFDRARSWAVYDGTMVRVILLLKFESIEPLGGLFARRLAELVRQDRAPFEADVVVPVPLHRQRERERGYNQAALIAKPLAKLLRRPCKSVLLTRIRPRPDKQILSMKERWESVRGAFATRPGSQVDNLRVLLVDDVMTTGATLDSCARTLREAGAKSVAGLTVARTVFRDAASNPGSAAGVRESGPGSMVW